MKKPNLSGGELKRIPVLLPGDVPTGSVVPGMDSGVREAKLLWKNLTADEIAEISAKNEHDRTENFRNHFERIAICGLWIAAIAIALVAATWFYHIILPPSAHWLSDDGIAKLQNIVTGGVLAAVAGGHLKRRLG